MVLFQNERVSSPQFLPKPMSIRKLQKSALGLKSGVGVFVVHSFMEGVQAAWPSQQPRSGSVSEICQEGKDGARVEGMIAGFQVEKTQ